MSNVEAKIRISGKVFGILVDSERAIAYKEGKTTNIMEVLASTEVFTDVKKGMRAGAAELDNSFSTTDVYKIAERIMSGEIQAAGVQVAAEEVLEM